MRRRSRAGEMPPESNMLSIHTPASEHAHVIVESVRVIYKQWGKIFQISLTGGDIEEKNMMLFKITVLYFKMKFIPVSFQQLLLLFSVLHYPSEIILIC